MANGDTHERSFTNPEFFPATSERRLLNHSIIVNDSSLVVDEKNIFPKKNDATKPSTIFSSTLSARLPVINEASNKQESVQPSADMPGFREPGVIATNYEIATGMERYELLKELKGEDPFEDLHPIYISKKGTSKDPIIVRGVDEERYIGCTGFY